MTKRAAIFVALLLGALSVTTSAQTLRGKVVQPSDGQGIAGVLVVVTDSTGNVVARALTDERGDYRIAVPRTGAYSVRTLRIGYQPSSLVAVELRARSAFEQQLDLTNIPIALDTVRVARARCSSYEGSSIVASAWEQARMALGAAIVTSSNQVLRATVMRVQRTIDPKSGRVRRESSRQDSGFVTKPWGTVPPDSLRRFGYIYRLGDQRMTYYAPDIETLLSGDFLQDHCFRFASGRDSTLLGIAFEPTRERTSVPEIAGTVWLDRKSAELRRMEFRYVTRRTADRLRAISPPPGGAMNFGRMMNGGWAISDWEIRIPILRERVRSDRAASGYDDLMETYIAELHVETGVLMLVTRGQETLWRAK